MSTIPAIHASNYPVSSEESSDTDAPLARGFSSENTSEAARGNETENAAFLQSYANDHPAGPSEEEAPGLNDWLKENEKAQNAYNQGGAAKESVVQRFKLSQSMKDVASQIEQLPSDSPARQQATQFLNTAKENARGKSWDVAQEYLGYAQQAVDGARPAEAQPAKASRPPRPAVANPTQFPHGGKHRPGLNTTKVSDDAIKAKIKQESKNGDAKYNTSKAEDVNKLETEAYDNGLTMSHDGGFTIVHKFGHEIGASEGQMTSYHRMDGPDHGHPITEARFDGYIEREIAAMRKSGGDMSEISDYLKKIEESPGRFGLNS